MRTRVPGVSHIELTRTEDGRLVLRSHDQAFRDPFIASFMRGGTIKMLAYLLLLHDPKPHPLLAVQEPENQLYPNLLLELVEQFRDYAKRDGQVFLSTHSPYLLNGAKLSEVFCLTRESGFSTVRPASASQLLKDLVAEGDKLGALWGQGLLAGATIH